MKITKATAGLVTVAPAPPKVDLRKPAAPAPAKPVAPAPRPVAPKVGR